MDLITAGETTAAPSTQTSSTINALLDDLPLAIFGRLSLRNFMVSPSTMEPVNAGETTATPSSQPSSTINALLDDLSLAIFSRPPLPDSIISPSTMEAVDPSETTAADSSQTPGTVDTLPEELLLAIFGELSLKERAKVRTVSKRWNNLVMDLGIHLDPLFVDDKLGVPFYSSDFPIRRNIWAVSVDYLRHMELANELQIPSASLTQMEGCPPMYFKRSQFLTHPPISTLALQVVGPLDSGRQPMHAMLRATKGSGGIRVGDVLDVFDKMRAYDTKLSLVGWEFAAWYATKKDDDRYDDVCERASTSNGIEIRKCNGKDE